MSEIITSALGEGRDFLYEHEGKEFVSHFGVPVAKTTFAKTEDEAVSAAERTGYPIVLKVVSPQILHKSDAGGVLLDLKTPDAVREGYRKIVERVGSARPDAEWRWPSRVPRSSCPWA